MTAVFSMAGFYTAARPSGLRPASQILQDGGRRASEMVAERVAEMAVAAETEVERQVLALQQKAGFTSDYDAWIAKVTPPDLE